MATVTMQVLEGFEAGRLYCDLHTPITIGREEDNDIRLNDDRVSRFHAKIQEDAGRVILTDLDSTNGTRVNGHPVRMRVLQLGDQILFVHRGCQRPGILPHPMWAKTGRTCHRSPNPRWLSGINCSTASVPNCPAD